MFANGLSFPCPCDQAGIPRSQLTGPCSATFHLCVLGVPGNGRAVPATDAPAASAAVQLHGVPAPSPLLCCPPTWPSTGKHKGKGTSKQAPAGNCRRRHSAFDGAKHHFPPKNC